MSATKYNLTLVGVNKMSPALTGAAADAGDLTSVLKKQREEARKLNTTQKELGRYGELKQGMAATRQQLKKTQDSIRGLAAEQKEAKVSVAELAAEKQKAARKVQRLTKAIDKAGVPTAKLAAEYKEAKAQADQLGEQHDTERVRLKKLGAQFEQTKADAKGLKAGLEDQRATAHRLGNELRTAGVDTGNFAREQARLRRETDATSRTLDKQKENLKALGAARGRAAAADARLSDAQGDIVGVAAMGAAAIVPMARAVTMEAAMADVAKVTSFEGDEKDQFQSDLQRLAVDVNIPPEQLTQIAAAAGQSGIEKEDLAGFTGAAARMGVAFDMGAAEAGETMAAWRAGMALNQEQAESLADAVNHVSNSMNAKAKDISGVLKRQGAVATSSGMTESQTASLAGALLSGGASEEVAATTMKNMLGALTKGDSATGGQKDAMAALGFDAGSLAFDMQADAVGSITQVFEALADAPVEQQSALISELFGEESKGGIMPLLKNQQLLQKAFGLTAKQSAYAGSALIEYKNRAGVTEHRLGSAWRAIDRLGIVLGKSLLPVVGPVADGVVWAAEGLADLAEAGGAVTSVVTGAAAAYVTYRASMLAWRLVRAKVESMRANAAVSAAEKEVRLASATDKTADKATLATRALDRFNGALGRTASGGAADHEISTADRQSGSKKKKARRSRGRRGRFGRLFGGVTRGLAAVRGHRKSGADAPSMASRAVGIAKNAAMYGGGGAALMMVPGVASAATDMDTGGAMDLLGQVTGPLSDIVGSFGGLAAKLVRPVDALLQSRQLVTAAAEGSSIDVGGAVGEVVGGTGGAVLGAAIGTAVLPGLGTIAGSLIGGYIGDEGGGWLGEKIGSWFSSDAEHSAIQKELLASDKTMVERAILEKNQARKQSLLPQAEGGITADQSLSQQSNQQVTFSPQITVNAPAGANADQVAELAMQKMQAMFNSSVLPALNPTLPGRLDDSMEIMP